MRSTRVGLYRIIKVEPMVDPLDMFFADVEWVGYEDEAVK